MEHHFNIEIAKQYGVDESIILHNINFWVQKNSANKKHFYDNDYWTYNSVEAFTELFPYWTRRQIERIINSLVDQGLIKKGNYNKSSYDRTTWYGLTELSKSYYSISVIHSTKNVNGFTETVEPIPYSNTDSKLNNNTKKEKDTKKESANIFKIPELSEIIEYFNLKGYNTDTATKFHEYYGAGGWCDSKGNKVKNWKQKALAVWFKEENKIQEPKAPKQTLSIADQQAAMYGR